MRLPWHSECTRVRRLASAFLDGRLAADARGRTQHHLRRCPVCLGELQHLARLSRAMHNLPPFRLADGMAQRLRRELAAPRRALSPSPTPRSRAVWRIAAATVLLALLPLAFWLGYRDGRASTLTPRHPTRIAMPSPTPTPSPLQPPRENARFAADRGTDPPTDRASAAPPRASAPDARRRLEQLLREMFGDPPPRETPR
ncbi:MAG: zf-HC2 domain-containing protein [Planctomycetota bacterium]